MNISNSDTVLGVHSKFHQPHTRNSYSGEYDARDALPPKHPGRRSSGVKFKQVAFWDTESTETQSSNDLRKPYSRNSWSSESDSKDLVSRESPEILHSPITSTDEISDPERCSQSSGDSASCESDSKDEIRAPPKLPGIHRSASKTKRVISWEIDLISDVKSLTGPIASPRGSSGKFDPQEAFAKGCTENLRGMHQPKNFEISKYSRNPEGYYPRSDELVLTPQNLSNSCHLSGFHRANLIPRWTGHHRNLDDGDVRRIVDGILKELRPPVERSISCSSSCSGCCSCCNGSCSNFGTWTPRPSTPAVDIPKARPKPAFFGRIHGITRTESPVGSSCCCAQCIMNRNSYSPSIPSSSSWMTNSFCPKCLPPFDNDSLDSKISIDSLQPQSIFSLDSLNSLTDPDSLEYSKTNISVDSLDSLDSCCNYDSLSENSKDSGFFSCSLPVVC